MKIGPLNGGERPHRPEEEHKQKVAPEGAQPNADQSKDSVEISRDGRHLSDSAKIPVPPAASQSLQPETTTSDDDGRDIRYDRIEQARQRIESGYYNDPEVTKKIARRLIDDMLE